MIREVGHKRNRGTHNTRYRNGKAAGGTAKRNWSNTQQDGKRKKLNIGTRLKESDVAITEFMGDDGFFGVIKERYTDFHVNEIALDGQIAKLTNDDIPTEEKESDMENLKSTVSDSVWDQLQKLKEENVNAVEIDVTDIDKDQRRAIHKIAKTMTNVISQTIDKEDKKIIVILPKRKDGINKTDSFGLRHNFHRDKRVDWKQRGGEYCHFLLHKINMETMNILNQFAMSLHMRTNNFNYAGTKDRRACTTQWVSIRATEPYKIWRASKFIRGVFVGNFKFDKRPLKLGMLKGNHFRIALRNASGTDEQIEKTMIALRDNGFINYYGLQRFGTVYTIPTHEIGKALLQGKWEEAIELILKPRDCNEDKDLAEARKIYETTKDACAAYEKVKTCGKIETALLRGLSLSGNKNPQGALDSIPRNARLMYIHAYQSYVWNLMVSRRIREFGKKPIVGDLVYENNSKHNDVEEVVNEDESEPSTEYNISSNEKSSEIETKTKQDDEEGEMSEAGETSTLTSEAVDAADCSLKKDESIENIKTANEKDDESHNLPAVKILTEEDLPNYSLSDVLMPQVGWKVTYPPYAKPWFDDFLGKDGLTTDLRQKNKKYSLGGAYRKILEIPSNLSWKIMRYKEEHSDLILPDYNEMRNSPVPKDDPEGRYKAVILEMSLKPSSYATMALREILKSDTSPQAQAAQFATSSAEEKTEGITDDLMESESVLQDSTKKDDTEKSVTVSEEETKDDKMDVCDTA